MLRPKLVQLKRDLIYVLPSMLQVDASCLSGNRLRPIWKSPSLHQLQAEFRNLQPTAGHV